MVLSKRGSERPLWFDEGSRSSAASCWQALRATAAASHATSATRSACDAIPRARGSDPTMPVGATAATISGGGAMLDAGTRSTSERAGAAARPIGIAYESITPWQAGKGGCAVIGLELRQAPHLGKRLAAVSLGDSPHMLHRFVPYSGSCEAFRYL
jgi:hypothetical protein